MDKNETILFTEISAYISRNPGCALRCSFEDFFLQVFYRISPFSIGDVEIERILNQGWFQTQLDAAGIALWVGRSDGMVRLVDQIPHHPLPLKFGPAKPHCSYCLMTEPEWRFELVPEKIDGAVLKNSLIHLRCRRAMKTYRQLAEQYNV